jgi:hypothetical protein
VARAIVASLWALRQRALIQDNRALLGFIEAGPAAARDIANTTVAIDDGGPNEGGPAGLLGSIVNVPHQTRYPAYFLAAGESIQGPANGGPGDAVRSTDLFVFARSSASTPWQMTTQAETGGTITRLGLVAVPRPDPAHPGFAAAGRSAGSVAPGTVYPRLARYFQYWLAHGRAPRPTPFVAGTWTTGKGASMTADGRRQDGIDPAGGAIDHIDYFTAAGDGVHAFALVHGYSLVCSAFRGVQRILPPVPGASALLPGSGTRRLGRADRDGPTRA